MKSALDWENAGIFGRNKNVGHSFIVPVRNRDEGLAQSINKSPYYYSLNGIWKFNWVKCPSERPVDFYLRIGGINKYSLFYIVYIQNYGMCE
ncbi:hypothetical protein [Candidatus Harpocratesius sp.]